MKSALHESPAIVVLAAGMGSRFGGLKQVAPVGPNGETILEYSVFDAARTGFGKAVFVIKSTFEKEFCTQILPRFSRHIDVDYVLQDKTGAMGEIDLARDRLWGTGHAVLAAETSIDEPFVALNADDHYGHNAFCAAYRALQERWLSRNGSYFLVSYELGETLSDNGPVSRGICETEGGKLTALTEHTHLQKTNNRIESRNDVRSCFDRTTPVSMNLWGFTPDIFDRLRPLLSNFFREPSNGTDREFCLPDAIGDLLRIDAVDVEVIAAGKEWFGMTYQADHNLVCQRIATLIDMGTYPQHLWAT